MDTFRKEATLSFSFSVPFSFGGGGEGVSTIKGKNLLLLEQILSFKSRRHFGRAVTSRKQAGSHKRVELLVRMIEETWRSAHTP